MSQTTIFDTFFHKRSPESQRLWLLMGAVCLGSIAYFLFKWPRMTASQPLTVQAQTPSPSPVIVTDAKTGIQTYQSQSGQFTIQVPSSYQIHVNEAYRSATHTYSPVDNLIELDAPHQNKPYILLQYSTLAGPISLHDLVLNTTECDQVESATPLDLNIQGLQALAYLNVSCNVPQETRVYFLHNQLGYTININQPRVTKAQVETLLQTISFN